VAVLFEGSPRAVDAQVDRVQALVGGIDGDDEVWAESRRRQGEARSRVRFVPSELRSALADLSEAVMRPAAGIGYVQEERVSGSEPQGQHASDNVLAALQERILRAFDPKGTLGG
jgi:hypothetical protein